MRTRDANKLLRLCTSILIPMPRPFEAEPRALSQIYVAVWLSYQELTHHGFFVVHQLFFLHYPRKRSGWYMKWPRYLVDEEESTKLEKLYTLIFAVYRKVMIRNVDISFHKLEISPECSIHSLHGTS